MHRQSRTKKNLPVYQDSNEKCQTWHPTTPFCHSPVYSSTNLVHIWTFSESVFSFQYFVPFTLIVSSWLDWLWKLLNEPFDKLVIISQYQRIRKLYIVNAAYPHSLVLRLETIQTIFTAGYLIFFSMIYLRTWTWTSCSVVISGTVFSLCVFHRFWYGKRRVNLTCARLGHPQWVRRTLGQDSKFIDFLVDFC